MLPSSVGQALPSCLGTRAARQAHRKHRAFPRLARHGHVAPHHACELARDGKAEPRAAEVLRGRGIGLGEFFEQLSLRSAVMPMPVSETANSTKPLPLLTLRARRATSPSFSADLSASRGRLSGWNGYRTADPTDHCKARHNTSDAKLQSYATLSAITPRSPTSIWVIPVSPIGGASRQN
jgi:hypothetical protein